MIRYIILFFVSSIALLAECEPQSDFDATKMEALSLYDSAERLYDERNFAEAYDNLNQSYSLYNEEESILYIGYNCIKLVPGPYAPKRTRYATQKEHDFDRAGLGNKIKAYLAPKPLVVIQFVENSSTIIPVIKRKDNFQARATVINVPRTKRGQIDNQLTLENFSLDINGQSVQFSSDIASGEQQSKEFRGGLSYKDITVDSSERYGYKTFTKDW